MHSRFRSIVLAALIAGMAPGVAQAAGRVCDAVWHDTARGRDVPVRILMPDGTGRAPLILFSHGLGGSLDGGSLWTQAWADAGFIVIHLQHPGSDRSILQTGDGAGRGGRLRAFGRMRNGGSGGLAGTLRAAMTPEQLEARVRDVKFVLNRISGHGREGRCALAHADFAHVGMSGHSFGAHTTQALAGQAFAQTTASTAEPRITASIAFSPSPPSMGSDTRAMANVRRPFFSITGTADETPAAAGVSAADRERPFRAMPAGDKYLLVLAGANHADFGGNGGGMWRQGPNEHVRKAVTDSTIAFWRWTLLGDRTAKAKLDPPNPLQTSLGAGDRLERR